jgi:threonine/homoserine/homoserine lactone efflux protein
MPCAGFLAGRRHCHGNKLKACGTGRMPPIRPPRHPGDAAMPLETFAALMLFAFATSVSPGPNNMMLLASGVNFGFRRTVPHMLGIELGFGLLVVASALGLGAIVTGHPGLQLSLKIAGSTYLLWLAWKIAMSREMADGGKAAQPMGFTAAALFQWVNPKAWAMAVGAAAVYVDPQALIATTALITLAFMLGGLAAQPLWTGFGVALRAFLSDPVRLKWFNITMGALVALSIIPMVL